MQQQEKAADTEAGEGRRQKYLDSYSGTGENSAMNMLTKRREYVPPPTRHSYVKASPAPKPVRMPPASQQVPAQVVAALKVEQTPPTPGSKTQLRRAVKAEEDEFDRLCVLHALLISKGQAEAARLMRDGELADACRAHNAAVVAYRATGCLGRIMRKAK